MGRCDDGHPRRFPCRQAHAVLIDGQGRGVDLQSLRAAIASYLRVARGIACTPEQVFITSGYCDSLSLITHALLNPGDRVLIEDPGYPPTRQLLAQLQIHTTALPVDQDGMCLPAGEPARAAVITPAHQSPLCVSLLLPRRLELLAWANRQQAWIIEDDYDGEYRYISHKRRNDGLGQFRATAAKGLAGMLEALDL